METQKDQDDKLKPDHISNKIKCKKIPSKSQNLEKWIKMQNLIICDYKTHCK
jgi:hypothetical protein